MLSNFGTSVAAYWIDEGIRSTNRWVVFRRSVSGPVVENANNSAAINKGTSVPASWIAGTNHSWWSLCNAYQAKPTSQTTAATTMKPTTTRRHASPPIDLT